VLEIKIPSADIITYRIYEAKCIKEIERLNEQDHQIPPIIQYVQDYLSCNRNYPEHGGNSFCFENA
jgi:hypothetical protein